VEKLNAISRLEIRNNSGTTGGLDYNSGTAAAPVWTDMSLQAKWAIQEAYSPGNKNNYEVTGDPLLSQYRADLYRVGITGDYIWYARENYAIDNAGSVQTVGSFTNSDQDPFSLLKGMAGESVIYVKKANSGTGLTTNAAAYAAIDNSATGDYFKNAGGHYTSGTNIDLVIIPDLAVAAIQKMLPALTSLNE